MSKKRVAVTLRKPQASADVETFVASDVPADIPPPTAAKTPRAHVADDNIEMDAVSYRELTLYLPSDLVQSLSRYCLEQNLDLNRVIARAVRKHISSDAPQAQAVTWKALFEALMRDYGSKLSAFISRRTQSSL